ncbi:MAG: hypothetical protein WBM24_22290, partial [Candidatus Sulfotelmatobacter sp.]
MALHSTTRDRFDWSGRVHNHAIGLATLFEATGDESLLREALDLTADSRGNTPTDRLMQARTRAHLARLNGDISSALRELHIASAAFEEERERLAGKPSDLRDLAGSVERILGDLVGCYTANGDYIEAVHTIETGRFWHSSPPVDLERSPAEPSIAVAWVAASRWETVVISTENHKST